MADDVVLTPVLELFKQKFMWAAGEYSLKVSVDIQGKNDAISAKCRFNLWDPDSDELRAYAERYKWGFGPAVDDKAQAGVVCQLNPVPLAS